ncbi:sensor histidine kinase [Saccharicrinis fermentans]|uniref:histidine kinase n=1 Tax=Saccharicrinis fermentans DSM 9555 = JCM 21142 TaxID=869213 RepID=W7YHL5_9BACT|nr:HAMP domain-containing sensor histidine kinase [Saccharicrinis fermentans]GAF03951.1 alkaline phosphatase synthesis sensor protein PhoR [Saccharicrinis fermentans DSM 9555 = JCM 21142]
MKKKSFTGLVALMTFSLLGIILVQFLWMNNAIKVRKEKFNATIYDAMNATVIRMQREQQANYFFRQFIPQRYSSIPKMDTSPQSNTPYFPPSNGKADRLSPEDIIQKKSSTNQALNRGHIETHIEFQQNGQPKEVIIAQNNFDVNSEEDIYRAQKTLKLWQDSIKKVIKKSADLSALNFINQFSFEIERRSTNPADGVDAETLTRILNYELKARGIDLAYEYAVINKNNGVQTRICSSEYDRDKSNFGFVADLFPDDLIRSWSPLALDIYFPNQKLFIYKSLHILLGSSLLFTLFILITFYFTFRTILNQKKLSEIKSDFINNMTHEFKTPIATINLATDNIANPMIIDKPAHISPFLKIIKEENKRMNNQVERVLQMSLIEKQDFQLVQIKADLHILIQEAVEKIKLLAEQKSAVIQTDLQADLTVFNVDEVHFTNVIMNLLENALKYAKKTPEIKVSTQNTNSGIEIRISDNGIGMTKEQQSKAFEKFFRATKGNIHNVKGFGLGLSYVKAILDQHNGHIFVKSKLGEGTTFRLILPYS